MTGFVHVVLFHTSFVVYAGGIIVGLVLLAALYARSLARVLRRLGSSALAGAAVAAVLVLWVAAARRAALDRAAASWGHRSPGELLAFGFGDTFVIVTVVTFACLMFRKKARKAAAKARNGSSRRPRRRSAARSWERV